MDVLSGVLALISHQGIVYEKIDFSGPWGIDLKGDQTAKFWRLVKGNCVLQLEGEPPITLQQGDMVFVPHGTSHWIADSLRSIKVPIAEFLHARDNGQHMFTGPGEQTLMIGGHFEFDHQPSHPFLKSLPKIIHIRNANTKIHHWLEMTGELLLNELEIAQEGGKLMVNRLADVVLIHVIRAYIKQSANSIASGFLVALKDERISSVLSLLQDYPEKNWTIDQLSKQAAMSRSAFCTAFKKMVGETPLNYLTLWRMMKAKQILSREPEKIHVVAARVGYQSEAAFSRCFKTMVGLSPSVYREQFMGPKHA